MLVNSVSLQMQDYQTEREVLTHFSLTFFNLTPYGDAISDLISPP